MFPVLEFQVPELHLAAMGPLLLVLLGAVLSILIEAFAPRHFRQWAQISLTTITVLASLGVLIFNWFRGRVTLAGGLALSIDGPTYFMWMLLLVFGLLSFLLFAERDAYRGVTAFTSSGASVPGSRQERETEAARFEHTEIFALGMLALAGMMAFAAANDLVTMFVSLEVMSLPLYLLCGLARRRRLLSQEAAMKYFLLGSMSSALFLFGIALIYGYAGGFTMRAIASAVSAPQHQLGLLLAGMGLLLVGLLFKLGAVPFHSWTPDVYTGAPTPVTAFMAVCTKIAAVLALTRVLYAGLGAARWDWQLLLAAVAVLTMVVGAVVGVMQTDVKRMLAYSSIAHAGFILTALVGVADRRAGLPANQIGSTASVLFYLAAYGFATIGAFAIVTLVRHQGGESTSIASWAGLGRRHPFLGVAFALFLLSMAGIPLTAGFMGKWATFAAAWRGGYAWLVVIAIIASLVAAFFYLRLLGTVFSREHADEADGVEVVNPSICTWIPVVVGFAATIALGVFPGPLLDVAMRASEFLR